MPADPNSRLQGVLPVFQTPFHEDYAIDEATLEKSIHWIYDQGADGIVMAMVSETLRLDATERRQLAQLACKYGSERGGVIISVGAEATVLAVGLARHAQEIGADAVMAIPPVSVGAGEDELRRYFEAIVKAIDIPLIVQDASGYVGRPMSVQMQADLFNTYGDRIQFKPEASPIGPRLTALLDATGGKAKVFEGTGGIALVDSYRRGIIGTMPGGDMVWALTALWKALEAGDEERTYRIAGPLAQLVSIQASLDSFVAVEKYLLHKQGIFPNRVVRGPVGYTLDEPTRKEVDRLFDRLKAAVQ